MYLKSECEKNANVFDFIFYSERCMKSLNVCACHRKEREKTCETDERGNQFLSNRIIESQ